MRTNVLVNKRWRFKVYSKALDRFLTDEEQLDTRLAFTDKGLLYFPDYLETLLLVHYTDIIDSDGRQLLEGDLVECDQVTEFGSTIKRKGVVRYSEEVGGYTIDVFTEAADDQETAEVAGIKCIGHALVDKELFHGFSTQTN